MGKSKKPRIANFHHHDRPKSSSSTSATTSGTSASVSRKMKSFSRVSTSTAGSKVRQGITKAKSNAKANANAQSRSPTIPFQKGDRILLVGEGDFSFALSLATHHGCKKLLATSYDAERALYQKYPQAKLHIDKLCASGSEPPSSASRTLKRKRDENENLEGESRDGEGEEKRETRDEDQNLKSGNLIMPTETQDARNQVPKVLFAIDARKLGSGPVGGGKVIRNGFPRTTATLSSSKSRGGQSSWKDTVDPPAHQKQQLQAASGGPWDIICFNFPHVGGLSTDVNRQVRANQELLVSFFKACVPLLSEPVIPSTPQNHKEEDEDWPDSNSHSGSTTDNDNEKEEIPTSRTTPGQILISLFEGEPYTLWNIRDLARHAGLRVVTSFRFPWASYPGYSHARTLGEIEKRGGGAGRGGWRGEDREARMFVFEKKGPEGVSGGSTPGVKKRKKGGKGRRGENGDDDSD